MAELASRNLGEEQSVRVQDYLDDKLQTSNDLANLDVLLETVTNQQTLLRQQVTLFPRLVWISNSLFASFKRRKQLFLRLPRLPKLIREIYYNKQRGLGSSRPISTGVCSLSRGLKLVMMQYGNSIQVWTICGDWMSPKATWSCLQKSITSGWT